jgi:ferredoxin-NADP reductase
MPYQYFDTEVTDVIQETDVIRRYFIRAPKEIPFGFKAGQFIMLDLPIESKVTNRSYSIASPPHEDGIFELLISLKPDGLGTPYLFEKIKAGSHVKVSKPIGKFVLPDNLEQDVCFICTGTGVAPLRSMAHDVLHNGKPRRNLYLVFGNRKESDITYRKEFEELEQKHPEFKFIPTLSRADETWNGKKGYVHSVYEELFSDKRPALFYLCGWSNMLHEAKDRLLALGYDKKAIRFEEYD